MAARDALRIAGPAPVDVLLVFRAPVEGWNRIEMGAKNNTCPLSGRSEDVGAIPSYLLKLRLESALCESFSQEPGQVALISCYRGNIDELANEPEKRVHTLTPGAWQRRCLHRSISP